MLNEVAPGDDVAIEALVASFRNWTGRSGNDRPVAWIRTTIQIVSLGEVRSTLIVSAHLRSTGLANTRLDARTIVRTDASHRAARVEWQACKHLADRYVKPLLMDRPARVLTQGFIGRTADGRTTTLGRRGPTSARRYSPTCWMRKA
ncbi:MAG: hypothetical protein IPO12_06210 [Flavobacteriales bacterium]|nr:hypothetical protein [Flavobacteriales bacterium]